MKFIAVNILYHFLVGVDPFDLLLRLVVASDPRLDIIDPRREFLPDLASSECFLGIGMGLIFSET